MNYQDALRAYQDDAAFDAAAFSVKPSLEGLAYILRHPELWPQGFEWNFAWCQTCAMGLAWRLCNGQPKTSTKGIFDWTANTFALSPGLVEEMFTTRLMRRIGVQYSDEVTPLHVADAIDRYLLAAA